MPKKKHYVDNVDDNCCTSISWHHRVTSALMPREVVEWNNILKDGIDPDISETVFKKVLKSVINDEMIWSWI